MCLDAVDVVVDRDDVPRFWARALATWPDCPVAAHLSSWRVRLCADGQRTEPLHTKNTTTCIYIRCHGAPRDAVARLAREYAVDLDALELRYRVPA